MKPKISVVILTHNSYTEKSGSVEFVINSYLNQKTLPFEIIVVDNGSDNNNTKQLEAFCSNKPFIKIIKACTTIGGARNIGVKKASGTHIIFNDDDTIPLGNSILDQISAYCTKGYYGYGANRLWSPDIDWIKSHASAINIAIENKNWNFLHKISQVPSQDIRNKSELSVKMLTRSFIGNFGFISVKDFISVGGFPEYPGYGCEDDAFAFLCYLKLGKPIVLNDEISVLHISHPINSSNLQQLEDNKILLQKLFEQHSCKHFHISRVLFSSDKPIIDYK